MARRRGKTASVLAVAAAVLAAGCSSSSEKKDEGPTTREVIAQTADATVAVTNRVQGKRFKGSGFFFDAQRGLLLTSTQTIWDQRSIEITTNDGRKLHARLAARSPCEDVSVLVVHPKPPGLKALKLSRSPTIKPGDPVIAVGYPESFEGGKKSASAARGTAAAVDVAARIQRTLPTFKHLVQHQAPLARGMAGGPLIDEKGRVLGMNTAINTIVTRGQPSDSASLSYAVGSPEIRGMLSELKPAKRFIYEGWGDRHRCHNDFERLVRGARGFVPKGAKGAGAKGHEGHGSGGGGNSSGGGTPQGGGGGNSSGGGTPQGGGGGGGHQGH